MAITALNGNRDRLLRLLKQLLHFLLLMGSQFRQAGRRPHGAERETTHHGVLHLVAQLLVGDEKDQIVLELAEVPLGAARAENSLNKRQESAAGRRGQLLRRSR